MSNFHSSKEEQKDLMIQSLEKRLLETTQELHKAHKIIFNALQLMNFEQRANWAKANEKAGITGPKHTREAERERLLKSMVEVAL